ncbi:hypothetical protein TNCV_3125001 [Trichonephila clavipes]|nr:hypothetical protein TNCV_3125001 [Trichonephila clavipes]
MILPIKNVILLPSTVAYVHFRNPCIAGGPKPDYRQVPILCKFQLGDLKPDFAGDPNALRYVTIAKSGKHTVRFHMEKGPGHETLPYSEMF